MIEQDVRDRDVPLIVSYGGGLNSWAVLIWLRQREIVPDLILFADTGNNDAEKPETYWHMENVVRPWLGNYFPPITVVRNVSPKAGHKSLEDQCRNHNTMPSRAFGLPMCAQRWKIEPQLKFLNHWPPAVAAWSTGKKPIKILGIDAGEDHRARTIEDAKFRLWYPLCDNGLDREDCEALARSTGLLVPIKSACFFCPSSTKSEILWLAAHHPDLMERALAIEDRALTPGAIGALGKPHNLRSVKGLGRSFSWRSLIEADAATQAAMRERSVEPCMICST